MKNIKVRCFFGINRDNYTNESVFEITDDSTGKRIMSISFTPKQIVQLLGRMGYVEGSADVLDAEDYKNVGKKRINETIEVTTIDDYNKREEVAVENAKKFLEDSEYEWEVSDYLNSRDSFFTKEGKPYARVKITRYEG